MAVAVVHLGLYQGESWLEGEEAPLPDQQVEGGGGRRQDVLAGWFTVWRVAGALPLASTSVRTPGCAVAGRTAASRSGGCGGGRHVLPSYATHKCHHLSSYVSAIDPSGQGTQVTAPPPPALSSARCLTPRTGCGRPAPSTARRGTVAGTLPAWM